MASLAFAVKFSMIFFLLGLHLALCVLFAISFAVHSGSTTEAVALGIEIVQLIILPIRLYYYVRHRNHPWRLTHERLFFLCIWLISLTAAIWISVHTPSLLEDFAGLSAPEAAAIAVITLTWLSWTFTVHLMWIAVQEKDAALDDDENEPIPWPGTDSKFSGATRPRISHPKRISAKIVAVAHGSDPLLWARKKNRHGQKQTGFGAAGVQKAMPTYDPRDRLPPQVPPVKTTYNNWYLDDYGKQY
ncbi:hypothetical protein BD413DRAFT_620619 [Trametes elegans]|nr:hypothetical protein BD413DRAFT_620619 [Trametes elegans]